MHSITTFLADLQASQFAVLISESDNIFPWLESIHVVALVTVLATIAIIDLRLLGVAAHVRSVRRMLAQLLPITWVAFAIALATGISMFISRAADYAANPWFQFKVLLLLLAGANMALFHRFAGLTLDTWHDDARPPAQAQLAGLTSLALWSGVVLCGRWIGFTI